MCVYGVCDGCKFASHHLYPESVRSYFQNQITCSLQCSLTRGMHGSSSSYWLKAMHKPGGLSVQRILGSRSVLEATLVPAWYPVPSLQGPFQRLVPLIPSWGSGTLWQVPKWRHTRPPWIRPPWSGVRRRTWSLLPLQPPTPFPLRAEESPFSTSSPFPSQAALIATRPCILLQDNPPSSL